MLELKEKERICLDALNETCKKYEMEDYYSIYVPSEGRVCICKREEKWEVFIVERGIEFEKSEHKECIDACIELIKLCSYSIEEFKDASNEFKNIIKSKKIIKKIKK